MANEDSLKDQGDLQAAVLYSPQNIPRGVTPPQSQGGGYAVPGNMQQAIRGVTQPSVVTDSSKVILPADPSRKLVLIQNSDPVGNVWINFGSDAAVNLGFKLSSGGGGILLDNNCPTSAISAIGDIASNPFIIILST